MKQARNRPARPMPKPNNPKYPTGQRRVLVQDRSSHTHHTWQFPVTLDSCGLVLRTGTRIIGNINTIHIPQALISARCSGSKCSAAARPERTDSLAHARVYTNTSRAQLLLYLALATRQRQPTELDTESDVSNRTRSRGGHTHSLTQSLCTLSVSFSLCLFRVPPTV